MDDESGEYTGDFSELTNSTGKPMPDVTIEQILETQRRWERWLRSPLLYSMDEPSIEMRASRYGLGIVTEWRPFFSGPVA